MRSIATLVVAALLAVAIQCSPDQEHGVAILPRDEVCSPSQDGCAGCGAGYVQCGSETCYNPTAGDTCCSNDYACPAGYNCTSTIEKCIPDDPVRRASSCRIGDGNNYNNTGLNTTTTTTTITSTITSIIATASATTSSCDLSAATTGLPVTGSVASYGNTTTTVALNTTTSTLSLANATSVLPTTNPVTLNATWASPTISPPITGYTGAASGLQGQSSASLFALGCLLFMSALLL